MVQRGEVTYPRSHSQSVAEPEFKSKSLPQVWPSFHHIGGSQILVHKNPEELLEMQILGPHLQTVHSIQSVAQEYTRISEDYLGASGRNPAQTGIGKIEYFFAHKLEKFSGLKASAIAGSRCSNISSGITLSPLRCSLLSGGFMLKQLLPS